MDLPAALFTPAGLHNMRELSIIIPTCNRAALLDRCLTTIARNVFCDYEIVVIDGASTDRTPDVLDRACDFFDDRLVWIREDKRQGFVRAANRGFLMADGKFLTWLNDDARPLPGSYINAINQIEAGSDGVVALYHRWKSRRNIAFEKSLGNTAYQLCHVRGTLYANFAMARRDTFEKLNYFDERFRFYGADPDFSLKAWHAGIPVMAAEHSFIDHDEHADERRTADAEHGKRDNARLFAKWDLPPINPHRNDFDPRHPCTLRDQHRRNPAA
jgi:GT2 family glycosyltransferase